MPSCDVFCFGFLLVLVSQGLSSGFGDTRLAALPRLVVCSMILLIQPAQELALQVWTTVLMLRVPFFEKKREKEKNK